MNISYLNQIPELLKQNKLTKKEAVNQLAVFVAENYAVFGLHKYDEDFKSEVILKLLESGTCLLESYESDLGEFFTYFFCFIKNIQRTKIRKMARDNIQENITFQESIFNYENKKEDYENIDYNNLAPSKEMPDENIDFKELKTFFQTIELEDKTLLVLALKCAYYLTDEQIDKLCSFYSIDRNQIYSSVKYCREKVENKAKHRKNVEERRNKAYFNHRRYELEKIKADENYNDPHLTDYIYKKRQSQTKYWQTINDRLENGYLYLRPTNKVIANLLGICERQVSYYISSAKKMEPLEEDK